MAGYWYRFFSNSPSWWGHQPTVAPAPEAASLYGEVLYVCLCYAVRRGGWASDARRIASGSFQHGFHLLQRRVPSHLRAVRGVGDHGVRRTEPHLDRPPIEVPETLPNSNSLQQCEPRLQYRCEVPARVCFPSSFVLRAVALLSIPRPDQNKAIMSALADSDELT